MDSDLVLLGELKGAGTLCPAYPYPVMVENLVALLG